MSSVVRNLPHFPASLRNVREWSALVGVFLLDLVGVWLVTRRLQTTGRAPLGVWSLWATAVVLVAYCAFLRLLSQRDQALSRSAAARGWCAHLTAIGMVLVGLSLMLPGTRAIAVIGFWGILLTGDVLVSRLAWRLNTGGVPPPPTIERAASSSDETAAELDADTAGEQSDDWAASEQSDDLAAGEQSDDWAAGEQSDDLAAGDPSVTQRLTRRQSARGTAVLEGWVRADFAAGQRMATLHIAFCPPFWGIPDVYAEAVSGPEAAPRVTQTLPTGVRIDVRQPGSSSQPSRVGIQIFAEGRCADD